MQFTFERPAEKGSPLWLTQTLDGQLRRVSDRLAGMLSGPIAQIILAMAAGFVAFTLCMNSLLVSELPFGELTRQFGYTLMAACYILLLSVFLFKHWEKICRNLGWLFALTFLLGVLSPMLIENWMGTAPFTVAVLLYRAFALWVTLYLSREWPRLKRLITYFAFLVLAILIPQAIVEWQRQQHHAAHVANCFWPVLFMLPFLVMQEYSTENADEVAHGGALLQFSPLNFLYTLPVPLSMLRAVPANWARLRAQGLLSVWGGLTLLFVAARVHSDLLWTANVTSVSTFLWRGWTNYLFYYFGWLGLLHLAVGIGRWMGLELQSPAYFALLSGDLLARWKRWNFYFYWFMFTFLWLPITRATGWISLATAAAFAVDFVGHNVGMYMTKIGRDDLEWQMAFSKLQMQGLFYLGHALAVYLGFKLRPVWPREEKLSGWLGVLLTHLVMAAVHGCLNVV